MVEPTAAVGFIGVGDIGAPMCEHLIGWPGGLYVLDRRPEAVESFVSAGATSADSVQQVAAECGVICIMVQTGDQVRSLLDGDEGILANARPGTVVVVHSTISVEEAAEFAEMAAHHDIAVLDAPVSGGAMGARQGELAVMVGGARDAFEKALPVLETFGGLIKRMGDAGAGTRTKIARNLITFASYAAVGESMRLAEASGLDIRKLAQIVLHSDALSGGPGAIMVRATTAPMEADDPLRPYFEHAVALGLKDVAFAVQMGEELGVDVSVARLTEQKLPPALGL